MADRADLKTALSESPRVSLNNRRALHFLRGGYYCLDSEEVQRLTALLYFTKDGTTFSRRVLH